MDDLDNDNFRHLRFQMVEKQIITRSIKDHNVLNAMINVPRHLFLPESLQSKAYNDTALPIGYKQTISQPYIVALMTEAAQISKEDKVLEIGTGSGYQSAILSIIAKEVYTVEIVQPLLDQTSKVLQKLNYNNIKVKLADGHYGWAEYAPYDAIIVTASPEQIPKELIDQLKIGGRLIIPVGDIYNQNLIKIIKTKTGIEQEFIEAVRFVPLVNPE